MADDHHSGGPARRPFVRLLGANTALGEHGWGNRPAHREYAERDEDNIIEVVRPARQLASAGGSPAC
jgi:hypothetical protein